MQGKHWLVATVGWLTACSAPPAVTPTSPSAPARHRADELTFVDVMPEYWQWWTGVQTQSAEQQANAFYRTIVPAHPDLYSSDVFGKLFADEASAHAKLVPYFASMPARVDAMRAMSAQLHDVLREGYAQFLVAFPDMAWTGPAYILPSILKFDGGSRWLAGKAALMFAPDGIVEYHRIDGKLADLCPFIAHEMFHIYHQHFLVETPDQAPPLWSQLWIEGLATYVGGRQCPTSAEADVVMSTTLAGDVRPRLAAIARELRDKLDARDDASAIRFFSADTHTDMPSRAGYFVGLLVAQRAARAYTPAQLAKLAPAKVRALIEDALDELAAATP